MPGHLYRICILLIISSLIQLQAQYTKEELSFNRQTPQQLNNGEPLMSLTHAPGDLSVTIFNDGSIGADNAVFLGNGVRWKGQNGLFVGGLIFGSLDRASINGVIGVFSLANIADLRNVESNFAGGFSSDSNFDQITTAVLDDSAAPKPYGINIIQQSYSSLGNEFGFIRYGFVNQNSNSIDGFYAGIFCDWDVAAPGSNAGGYDMDTDLVYVYDTFNPSSYYYGITALNGLSGMMVDAKGPFATARTDAFAQIAMLDPEARGGTADMRAWVGSGPFDLPPGDTTWVTFAVVAGDDLSQINEHAQAARTRAASLDWLATSFDHPLPPAQHFIDVIDGAIGLDAEFSSGVSWGDYDNDHDIDMLVTNLSTVNSTTLYQNLGNGNFSRVNASPIGTAVTRAYSSVWGDYDNDGLLDVYISNGGTSISQPEYYQNFLFRNLGDPDFLFQHITSGSIASDSAYTWSSSWVDYDNDGDLDLHSLAAQRLTSQTDVFYENDGLGNLTSKPMPFVDAQGSTTSGVGSWIDYDNDGDQDLFIAKSGSDIGGEPNELYQNQLSETGTADFTQLTDGGIVNTLSFDFTASWGDYDNDGDPDLFSSVFSADNRLYRNDVSVGAGFATIDDNIITSDGGASLGSAWGDFDNDGDLDLFVAAASQEFSRLYSNVGQGKFIALSSAQVGFWLLNFSTSQGCAWGDYDNDGDLDLYVANSTAPDGNPVRNFLYENELGNSNQWINITCEGSSSNRSAIGTKIRAKATINGQSYWQLRHVSGSPTGDRSQNSLRVHFGFGDATLIDSLLIEWPSGIVDQYAGVTPGQFYLAREGSSLEQLDLTGIETDQPISPERYQLSQNYPNPFNPETTIHFTLPKSTKVSLEIYNILGQTILTLVNDFRIAGQHQVQWSGRDQLGNSVASGVYIYTLRSENYTSSKKMLLIR